MKKVVEYWSFIVFAGLSSMILLAMNIFPSSYWLEVRKIYVADAKVGESPKMAVVREIKRPFLANWSVTVRRWEGGWVLRCSATGTNDYKVDAKYPADLDLKWWTNGACATLPEGRYIAITTWTWNPAGLMPNQQTGPIESNVFEVK